jgi:hypothetical protein
MVIVRVCSICARNLGLRFLESIRAKLLFLSDIYFNKGIDTDYI